MIERDFYITFCCDGCSEELDTEEEDLVFANEVRKTMGWGCWQDFDGDWIHYCPICQEKME